MRYYSDKLNKIFKTEEELTAEEIVNKAKSEAAELLKPAKEQIREAQYNKYEKVKQFNNKYGPYSVSYTGEKAYNEFKRSSDWFNYLLNEFFYS